MVACFSSSFLLFLVPIDVCEAGGSEDGIFRRLLLTAAAAAAAAATAAAAADTAVECRTEPTVADDLTEEEDGASAEQGEEETGAARGPGRS